MKRAFLTVLAAWTAITILSAPAAGQIAKVPDAERERVLVLADQLVGHIDQLNTEAQRASPPTTRIRTFRALVDDLENEAVAFRAALRRNRPLDLGQEVESLRGSLSQIEARVHPRRAPDATLRRSLRQVSAALDGIEREAADLGASSGKATARFEPGRYAEVDDLDRLAAELVDHANRMRDRATRTGRSAPAVTHFAEQAQQLQRVVGRRTFAAVDHRPHLRRLQADLNAALREIRRAGSDEALIAEWEWSDGLLERMQDLETRGVVQTPSNRAVPEGLLGLSHDLHVQMMKAEELAKASGRGGDAFTRLGDLAYAFHHEMHDGRLSHAEAQDRVESALRGLDRAEAELRRGTMPGELQQQWREVRATVEKMRSLMGV